MEEIKKEQFIAPEQAARITDAITVARDAMQRLEERAERDISVKAISALTNSLEVLNNVISDHPGRVLEFHQMKVIADKIIELASRV